MRIDNPNIIGLPDLCASLFSFALRLKKSSDPGDAGALRSEIRSMLAELDDRGREAQVAPKDIESARFALVALLDEIVMTSEWSVRDDWQLRPLQLDLFNTNNAGEEFYDRVREIQDGPGDERHPVQEVFATCVALGFRGKYGTPAGMEKLRGVLGDLVQELTVGKGAASRVLAPNAARKETVQDKVKRFPVWIAAGCAIAAVLALVIVLRGINESDVGKLKKQLEPFVGTTKGSG